MRRQYKSHISQRLIQSFQTKPSQYKNEVLQLSQIYHQRSLELPLLWKNPGHRVAYIHYFLHINLIRLVAVLDEATKLGFFSELTHLIDYGSGPGTFHFAALEHELKFKKLTFIEQSPEAIQVHKTLLTQLKTETKNARWQTEHEVNAVVPPQTLSVFCYSLNELKKFPNWALDSEALLIVEPSTQTDSRNLQVLREELIQNGFHIWAPCPHHQKCPLLIGSKTDWCHMRIHTEQPKELIDLERHLPMQNNTLTYSFLLAKKTPPPLRPAIRVIGDTLYERGKVRQAICRSSKREFMSWLTKHGEPPTLERGAFIDAPANSTEMGNELRVNPKEK